MRHLKLLSIALMAIFAVSIAAATTAQAEATLEALPAKAKFAFKSTAGEKTELVTLSGKKIHCLSATGTGVFTSKRLGLVEFKFTDCLDATTGVKCTGLEDMTTGNITVKAEFHLRHLLPSSEGVHIIILVGHVHFSCVLILILVLGCVGSMDILDKSGGVSAVNLLLKSLFVSLLQENGDSLFKELLVDTDNSLGTELCILETKEGTAAYESSAQLGSGTVEKCEEEGGKECSFLFDLSGTF